MENLLKQHFDQIDLDIRKKPQGYSRFMDQKVTPDVLSFVAECILNLVDKRNKKFSVKDIWQSDYLEKNTMAVFGKPAPSNKTASAEYNKFIGQPLKTLSYSKILIEYPGNPNLYQINNRQILEYIALNQRNAFLFL
ncbi:MAG: hypothetical protein NTX00_03485, partial [Candidatus Parcubacteria bacterium]|nr:hypothetical protein [Candidatus Parcubacteria bacterium]